MGIKSLGNIFSIGNLINIQRKQKDTSVTNYYKVNATNNKSHNQKYSRFTSMVKIKSELDLKKAPLSSLDNDGIEPTTTDNGTQYFN